MNEKIDFIIKTIQKILKREFFIDPTSAISALGLTSLQMVQLAVFVEEKYGCEIHPEAMSKIKNITDLVLLIKNG